MSSEQYGQDFVTRAGAAWLATMIWAWGCGIAGGWLSVGVMSMTLAAFASGLLTLAASAGALAMKTTARPILHGFGFRSVLVVNGVISSVLMFATGFFSAGTSVVVMLLVRFEMVTIEKLKSFRGYFIVVAFVVAAVLTPPDVVSQLALAIPMCLLYEIGIIAARYFVKHSKAPDENESADSAQS